MRLVILLVSICTLVFAKPETYREKEDFQFSRYSSDKGSKSGYYGAQRGNTGGNYEKAHNMDLLAQHQMGSLVKQVDGELGSGANTRTGSVYTSGLSKGIYGSGNYDLSNLKGRNFDEGITYGDSQSHSSLSNAGYGGQRYSTNNARLSNSQYQSSRQASSDFRTSQLSTSDLMLDSQQTQNLHSNLDSGYNEQAANNYRYISQANQRNRGFEENIGNVQSSSDFNTQRKLSSGTPARILIRPGTSIIAPVLAPTYDASHFNELQNSANSDAEVISNSGSHTVGFNKPVTKHYESSYNYRKEWEKHDAQPIGVPTIYPYLKNSELYDNTQVSDTNLQENLDINNGQSSRLNSAYINGYSTGSKLASSHRSMYEAGSASQSQNLAALSDSQSSDFSRDHTADDASKFASTIDGQISRPKSYHSSYSYHKAWERQGDPYIIKPVLSDVETSQRLTDASASYGHSSSHQHGSHYSQSHQSFLKNGAIDCDEHGHVRVARSYQAGPYALPSIHQDVVNLEQQQNNQWENLEDLGQQTQEQWSSFTGLGQQTQDDWSNVNRMNQQHNKVDKLKNFLEQENENKWHELDDMKNLQENENKWHELDDMENSQTNYDKMENVADLGQQTQNNWVVPLENLGQQTQDDWSNVNRMNQQQNKVDNLEVFLGQQNENKWNELDHIENSQNNPDRMENFGQQTKFKEVNQKPEHDKQESEKRNNFWDKLKNLERNTPKQPNNHLNYEQELQNAYPVFEEFLEPQRQNSKLEDLGQQNKNTWGNPEDLGQETQYIPGNSYLAHKNQDTWRLENLGSSNQLLENKLKNTNQDVQSLWYNFPNVNKASHNNSKNLENHQTQNMEHINQNDRVKFENNEDILTNDEFKTIFISRYLNQNQNNFHENTNTKKATNTVWDHLDKMAQDLSSKNYEHGDTIISGQSYRTELNNTSAGRALENTQWDVQSSIKYNNNDITTSKKGLEVNKVQTYDSDSEPKDTNIVNENHKRQSTEIGRGDIGSEDELIELSSEANNKNSNFIRKLNKNEPSVYVQYTNLPTKKENLGLLENTSTSEDISVLGLQQNNVKSKDDLTIDSTTASLDHNYNKNNKDLTVLQMNKLKLEYSKPEINEEQKLINSLSNPEQYTPQQDFDQQSFDQQFTDLSQFNQELQSQTFNNFDQEQQIEQNLNDFSQNDNQEQVAISEQYMKLLSNDQKYNKNQFNDIGHVNKEKMEDLETASSIESKLEIPVEPVTPKPGFWKAVGSKLTNAKNSVINIFKRN